MKDVNQIIDEMQEELVATLQSWLRIPSTKAEPVPGAPFGAEVKRALDKALADCERFGFSVRDFDGYIGDARMGPTGVDPLAVLAHLDVVPPGDGWTVDPYGALVENGRIYGRGTSDDKGPAVAALFAMRAVLESGAPLRREVRLILGCDEESGWEDIAHYEKNCDMPKTGFSPDACYPVINTEKGLLHLTLHGEKSADGLNVIKIDAGHRVNVIPGQATALVEGGAELAEKVSRLATDMHLQVEAEVEGGGVKLISTGINGHAAHPQIAKNAIGQLLLMLRALGVNGPLKTLADRVGMEYDGLSLGIRCSDDTSGPLTNNLGILRYDDSGVFATFDIRYPLHVCPDMLIKTIQDSLEGSLEVRLDSFKKPHHVSPDSELVRSLLDAYHEETGRPKECIAIGGGTYARSLKEGVAFGCTFPEDEDLAHQAGENMSIDCLMQNVRIFARAIMKLCAE